MDYDEKYYEDAVALLQRGRLVCPNGFDKSGITWHGKGHVHCPLMKVTRAGWTVPINDGGDCKYQGVNVHFESNAPGDLKLHCELFPRDGSESKKNQDVIRPFLELKGCVGDRIRKAAMEQDWEGQFRTHLRRTGDLNNPKNLMVLGFDLDLPTPHAVDRFVSAVEVVISGTYGTIDQILTDLRHSQ